MSHQERFLVTGGNGFLGAWIVRQLVLEGATVAILDVDRSDHILEQVLDSLEPPHVGKLDRIVGDIRDQDCVARAVRESRATAIVHLAGLQIPACRADPLEGARVNLLGTLNVFEAARKCRDHVLSVVYASSAAVAGPSGDYSGPIPDDAHHRPQTHYGVYKLAGEGCARVYWLDHGMPSAGVRPLVIYGVGREVGISSGPTKAVKAASLGRPYAIGFCGMTGFHYVEDVARAFIACARSNLRGAHVFNLRGDQMEVADFVRAIDQVLPGAQSLIRVEGKPLPVAHDFLETRLESVIGRLERTPVLEGLRRMVERYRQLQARGRLQERDLET